MGFSPQTGNTLRRYWAERLGVPVSAFEKADLAIGTAEERGVHLFRHGEALVVTAPSPHLKAVEHNVSALTALDFDSRDAISDWFDGFVSLEELLGPAFYGYTDSEGFATVNSAARLLESTDEAAYEAFRSSIPEDEWDAGGTPFALGTTVGLFEDDTLVAVAGYTVWDDCIAHISIATHPDYRNAGNGRAVVSRATERALAAGLIPQYRTLDEWPWSVALAQNLGFERFATSYLGVVE